MGIIVYCEMYYIFNMTLQNKKENPIDDVFNFLLRKEAKTCSWAKKKLKLDNMKNITFVTGNQNKADYLAEYLGYPVNHVKLDLDEIQSTSLEEIVEHKVRQAYEKIKKPVIVEDVSLEFVSLGGLPGPFIKFFVEKMSFEDICSMIGDKKRDAIARCVFGYFDGDILKLFESSLNGKIAKTPSGNNGYGWDKIFIPDGYTVTRASLNKEDDRKTYLQIKPFEKLKKYLEVS